jgi:hypothetical protein
MISVIDSYGDIPYVVSPLFTKMISKINNGQYGCMDNIFEIKFKISSSE